MSDFERTKNYISESLRRIAIMAKGEVENGEWSQGEAEDFIRECGNEHFNNILTMSRDEFAEVILDETIKALAKRIGEVSK